MTPEERDGIILNASKRIVALGMLVGAVLAHWAETDPAPAAPRAWVGEFIEHSCGSIGATICRALDGRRDGAPWP